MEILYAIGGWLLDELGFVVKFLGVILAIVLAILAINLHSIKKKRKK